jgi:hypothetical protein
MARTIIIERFLEQRDIDAALYLLTRMLGLDAPTVDHATRERLAALRAQLAASRRISPEQRREVISAYREVVG